ncbi:MAG: hypothetical protein ACYC1C_02330 [Chloroflexota bacterium]
MEQEVLCHCCNCHYTFEYCPPGQCEYDPRPVRCMARTADGQACDKPATLVDREHGRYFCQEHSSY